MSSMPISIEKLQQLIKCPICLETFRAPKTLKCLHTFCEDCLRMTVKASYQGRDAGFKCPECHSFTTQAVVTNNFHMVQLVGLYDEVTKLNKCVFCEHEEAKWKCIECVEDYCNFCKVGHLKLRASHSHKFVYIKDPYSNRLIDQTSLCKKHPFKALQYCCKVCKILLCVTCASEEHDKNHEYESIDDALKTCMPYAQEKINHLKTFSDMRKSRINALKERRHRIQARFEKSQKLAMDRKQEVIAKAEMDLSAVISRLTKIKENEEEKLEAAIITEDERYKVTVSSVQYGENTLMTSPGVHLLREMQDNTVPQLKEIIAIERCAPELPPMDHPSYHPLNEEDLMINCIGEVEPLASYIPSLYRFQDIDFVKFFGTGDLELENTVDIDVQPISSAYRIGVGFGFVCVCIWNKATIVIYTVQGDHVKSINIWKPYSACFLDEESLAFVSNCGLHLISIEDEQIKKLSNGKYSDVQSSNNILYALCYSGASIVIVTKGHDWASASFCTVDISLGNISSASTLVVTSSRIYVSNNTDTIYEYSMKGRKIRALSVEMEYPKVCAANLDGDVIVVGNTVNKEKRQCIIRGDKATSFKIPGVAMTQDIAFQTEKNIWVLEHVSSENGQKKLKHFKQK